LINRWIFLVWLKSPKFSEHSENFAWLLGANWVTHRALVTGTMTAMTPEVEANIMTWVGALEAFTVASEGVQSVLEAYPTIGQRLDCGKVRS
jgi:hypothetical protein